jgi:hypothetical protein
MATLIDGSISANYLEVEGDRKLAGNDVVSATTLDDAIYGIFSPRSTSNLTPSPHALDPTSGSLRKLR